MRFREQVACKTGRGNTTLATRYFTKLNPMIKQCQEEQQKLPLMMKVGRVERSVVQLEKVSVAKLRD